MSTRIMCKRCYNEATLHVTIDKGTGSYPYSQSLCATCALTVNLQARIVRTVKLPDFPPKVYTATSMY